MGWMDVVRLDRLLRETFDSRVVRREYELLGTLSWPEMVLIVDLVALVGLLLTRDPIGFEVCGQRTSPFGRSLSWALCVGPLWGGGGGDH
jgi:hypothetical protein